MPSNHPHKDLPERFRQVLRTSFRRARCLISLFQRGISMDSAQEFQVHHGSISPNKLCICYGYDFYWEIWINKLYWCYGSYDRCIMFSYRYDVLSCMDIPITWRNCNQRSTLPDCVRDIMFYHASLKNITMSIAEYWVTCNGRLKRTMELWTNQNHHM